MPITLTPIGGNAVGNQNRPICSMAFSGSYPTGGDTVDLTQIIGASHGMFTFVANNPPSNGDPALSSGFVGEFIPGSQLNNGKLKIFSASGAEIAAGAYSSSAAGLTTDLNSQIEFVLDKLS